MLRYGERCDMDRKSEHSLNCHCARKRAIQYAAASQQDFAVSGILDRPVEPGDDSCINFRLFEKLNPKFDA